MKPNIAYDRETLMEQEKNSKKSLAGTITLPEREKRLSHSLREREKALHERKTMTSILSFSLLPKPISFSSSPPEPPPSGDSVVSAAVSILKHHRSKSRWSHLRSLITTAKYNRLTPSQFSEISLQLRNNPHLVLRFFHFTLHHSLSSHSLFSYATVIHILSRSRLKYHALNVIKSAVCAFSEPQQETPIAILDALIKTYRICDSAPFVFDLLVKACLESKKIDLAIEIHAILKSKNVLLRTSTCISLIELVSKSSGCFAGYDLYREIFMLMLRILLEMGNVVEELWGEFLRVGCEPNIYSFNVLMAAYCDDERMEDAMRSWRRWEGEEIYREMVMNGEESTCITFEHLINGYCKVGDLDSAMMVYKDMCRKKFSPESSTVNVIIRLLCEKNEISAATEFWRTAVKKHGAVMEEENYGYLIRGLCEEGKMEEALNLQAEMVVKGFEPNSEIYGAFIDGYVEQGNETIASKLRKEMLCKQMS
ncbi:hypothetical protein DH2020_023842 [Rehmannia glutinosa]|uniref:Pentatricopeptide repeat-containing protein n=1 Tax=Rehmannia glutinosa TaxID=99300 RepID=A0ABR0WBP0_REHGL